MVMLSPAAVMSAAAKARMRTSRRRSGAGPPPRTLRRHGARHRGLGPVPQVKSPRQGVRERPVLGRDPRPPIDLDRPSTHSPTRSAKQPPARAPDCATADGPKSRTPCTRDRAFLMATALRTIASQSRSAAESASVAARWCAMSACCCSPAGTSGHTCTVASTSLRHVVQQPMVRREGDRAGFPPGVHRYWRRSRVFVFRVPLATTLLRALPGARSPSRA